jgi:hypothetical protein
MPKFLIKWWSKLFKVEDFNTRTLNLDTSTTKSKQLEKVQNASVGELVKKGDKLADLTWSLLRENHKLNVDLLKLSK